MRTPRPAFLLFFIVAAVSTPQTQTRPPICFADGLKGALLICHGMVDTNVLFQDSVRLVERLIELRTENWQFAPYPVESHGFLCATSWADEYKRILQLFEDNFRLKRGV
jgi:dipeptidyl aminopeptidase/acylaminoacyl peptidase